MNSKINVIDEYGKSFSSTYLKRAKGLVKKERAYWVDECTICLIKPQMEEKIMTVKEYKKMLALLEANNWAIKTAISSGIGYSYESASALANTYNGIVRDLKNGGTIVPLGLEEIIIEDFKDLEPQKLIQVLYNKDCTLHPLIKVELNELEKEENCKTKKANVNFDEDFKKKTADFINETKDSLNNMFSKIDDKKSKDIFDNLFDEEKFEKAINKEINDNVFKQYINELSASLEDVNDQIDDITNDIEDFKSDLADLVEEMKDLTADLEEAIVEQDDDERDDIQCQIEDLKCQIEDTQEQIEKKKQELQNLKNEVTHKVFKIFK